MKVKSILKTRNLVPIVILTQILSLQSLIATSIFDSPYRKIANFISEKAKDKSKSKIAVLVYQSLDEKNTAAGETISEEVILELVNNSTLNVVERTQVQKLISELQLNQTGVIDAATAKKIGNGLGADALVIGSYTEINDNEIKVFSKLVDTETFQILGANQQVMKKDWETEEKKASRQRKEAAEQTYSKFEVALMSGLSIPGNSMSTKYVIDAKGLVLEDYKIEKNISNINLSLSIPVALRANIWTGPIGFGFDVGYSSFQFANTTLDQTSTLTSTSVLGSSTNKTIKQTYSYNSNDFYQLNILRLSLNFLIRIPISPKFIPYAGIGYKFSIQNLSHTGGSAESFDPMTGKEAGWEFGFSASSASLDAILNLFTYMAGIQFYLFDNVGIGLEYQLTSFGDSRYYKLGQDIFNPFTYTDSQFGSIISKTSHSFDLITSPVRVHTIHLAVLFKFS